MPDYKAPLRDMRFVMDEIHNFGGGYERFNLTDATPDLISAVMEEAAKFAGEVLAPLNRTGDEEGCHIDDGVVTTPAGFKEAYHQFVEGGWPSMTAPEEFGGQGLPASLSFVVAEMTGAANYAWSMYPGLSQGCAAAIRAHGSQDQKEVYLTKLFSGQWTGSMCLTEPQCGTDLGLTKTRAVPQADGSYQITGTKIFISCGEHDFAENIVHLVLAKLPDAPEGTKGISLFIVPKFLPDANGEVGERNGVKCGSIEHKMGIKASATCVMNFDGAKGFLIGEVNKGLNCMFTMMNHARLGTGMQGLCHGEASYQNALAYAKDRLQMRALSGPAEPEKPADPIIVHPDVRRMLLTMKAFNEGNRALAYYTAQLLDKAHYAPDAAERENAEEQLAFLTPICKAFMTETGLEATNHGVQIFGGHGYVREWGQEQQLRDCRIGLIYEGTNGIQALDLLGRKVLMTQGKMLRAFTKEVHLFCKENEGNAQFGDYIKKVSALNAQWGEMTQKIAMKAMQNREEIGSAAMDYLMFSGYVTLAFFWVKMAMAAQSKLDAGTTEEDYYKAKLATQEFYFKRLLPRAQAHVEALESGADNLMQMTADQF
jgi:alkylation response protein AidB-like acyl-CoA dehydrogenase